MSNASAAGPSGSKVVVLGNSIVRHGPLKEIGWEHNWGMAASSPDSDFVHLLYRDMIAINSNNQLKYENLAAFESGYKTFDYSKVDSFKVFHPDILIMRLGENVNDTLVLQNNFINYYDSLINYIDPDGHAKKIICNSWWRNKHINQLLKEYAEKKHYTFINQTDLSMDYTNAVGQYENPAIQLHPNNLGMKLIEQSIWQELKKML